MNASQNSAEIISIDSKKTLPVLLPLSVYVKQTVELYLSQLSGHDAVDLHAMVISEVEKPLLEATLEHSGYNQTKAAKALGLSRSTLRKKLDQYGIS
ncbi:MAG: Fis family transcriptional regulator [Methylococcaceae bacterium]|jgi:Fis family transcriptional regulator|nr:Fis family transcriptional regulator [Methylococcaceae bacterium]MDD1626934.1 Fis family transcriptional regulator [Methylococcaceae bacterium]